MAGTGKAHLRDSDDVLLRVDDLVVEFPVGHTGLTVNAVSGISLDVLRGETLGVVGESGCGKSTTGRAIMQLPRPTSGSVMFEGRQLTEMGRDDMREARTRMQMIFQDPISSLNPRRKVRDIVMEPLTIWKRGSKTEQAAKVDALLQEVGIDPTRAAESQPHQFSGGQCQRISIAALARARPDSDHLRRARQRARRQRAGTGPEPARGPEGQVRPDADLHRARPGRGQEHQRPSRGDVPRQDLRGGAQRRPLPRTRPPLHRGAARLDSGAGPLDCRDEDGHRGRATVVGAAAPRLPIPPPLPRRERPLPHRGAKASARSRRRTSLPVTTPFTATT